MDILGTPGRRSNVRVAIVCTSALQFSLMAELFDQVWSKESIDYGKGAEDSYIYTTGSIAGLNIVLVSYSNKSNNAAARVSASVKTNFTGIEVALLIGICGAVPFYYNRENELREIVLGDCIISTSVTRFGSRCAEQEDFEEKDCLDQHDQTNLELRKVVAKLKSYRAVSEMTGNLRVSLKSIHKKDHWQTEYPGHIEDRLYEASYTHTHRHSVDTCAACSITVGTCNMDCKVLGCSDDNVVKRRRLNSDALPQLHFGAIGSSYTVPESAVNRDRLLEAREIIAFETEDSGEWDVFPTIIVKAVCDYADHHKNMEWRPYAAAVAASTAAALIVQLEIEEITTTATAFTAPEVDEIAGPLDNESARDTAQLELMKPPIIVCPDNKPLHTIPYPRNKGFIGRDQVLETIFTKLGNPEHSHQPRVGLVGLDGIGKTQIAVEYAYRLMEKDPKNSVYWISADDPSTFEQSYLAIAAQAQLKPSPRTIHRWLSDEQENWTLILDGLDSDRMLVESYIDGRKLIDYLPVTNVGAVLITSRTRIAAADHVGINNVVVVESMVEQESLHLLKGSLTTHDDDDDAKKLVDELDGLPFSIAQAASFIAQQNPKVHTSEYLRLLKEEASRAEYKRQSLVSNGRKKIKSTRSIHRATSQISIVALIAKNHDAADILSLMSMFDSQYIPVEILSSYQSNNAKLEECLSILEAYCLVNRGFDQRPHNLAGQTVIIHRAVRWATRKWLKQMDQLAHWQSESVKAVNGLFPPESALVTESFILNMARHIEHVIFHGSHADDLSQNIILEGNKHKIDLMIKYIAYRDHRKQYDVVHWEFCIAAFELALRTFPVDDNSSLILGLFSNIALFAIGSQEDKRVVIKEQRRLIAIAVDRPHDELYFLLRRHFIVFLIEMDEASFEDKYDWRREAYALTRRTLSDLSEADFDTNTTYRPVFTFLQARVVEYIGGPDEAISILEEAVNTATPGTLYPLRFEMLSYLASLLTEVGRLEEARNTFESLENSLPEAFRGNMQYFVDMGKLGRVLQDLGRYEDAARLQESLIDRFQCQFRVKGPNLVPIMKDHALSLFRLGHREKALKKLEIAEELAILHLGVHDSPTRRILWYNAVLSQEDERWDRAEASLINLLAADPSQSAPDVPEMQDCLALQVFVRERQGKWNEAEQSLRKLIENVHGKAWYCLPPDLKFAASNVKRIKMDLRGLHKELFLVLSNQEKWEAARMVQREWLIRDNGSEVDREYDFACRLIDLETNEHALRFLKSTLDMALAERNGPITRSIIRTIIDVLQEEESWADAEPFHRQLIELLTKSSTDRVQISLPVEELSNYAYNMLQQEKFSTAGSLWRRILSASEAIFEIPNEAIRIARFNLGTLSLYQYQYKEAEDYYRKSLEIPDQPSTSKARNLVGIMLYLQGRFAEAEITFMSLLKTELEQLLESNEANENPSGSDNDWVYVENPVTVVHRNKDQDTRHILLENLGHRPILETAEGDHSDEVLLGTEYTEQNREHHLTRTRCNEVDSSETDPDYSYVGIEPLIVWLNASVRAQGEDPSWRFESKLQVHFDKVILDVQSKPVKDNRTLSMPLDTLAIWMKSHKLAIQGKHEARAAFMKKYGLVVPDT